jgi:hypothetical protein
VLARDTAPEQPENSEPATNPARFDLIHLAEHRGLTRTRETLHHTAPLPPQTLTRITTTVAAHIKTKINQGGPGQPPPVIEFPPNTPLLTAAQIVQAIATETHHTIQLALGTRTITRLCPPETDR